MSLLDEISVIVDDRELNIDPNYVDPDYNYEGGEKTVYDDLDIDPDYVDPDYNYDEDTTIETDEAEEAEIAAKNAELEAVVPEVDMGSWNNITFNTNETIQFPVMNLEIKTGMEEKDSSDKAGKASSGVLTRKRAEMTMETTISEFLKTDVRETYNTWYGLEGQHAQFYLNGEKVLDKVENWVLMEADLGDIKLRSDGKRLVAKMSLTFQEWAPEQSKKKETVNTKNSNKKSPARGRTSTRTTKTSSAKTRAPAEKRVENKPDCVCVCGG